MTSIALRNPQEGHRAAYLGKKEGAWKLPLDLPILQRSTKGHFLLEEPMVLDIPTISLLLLLSATGTYKVHGEFKA